MALPIILGGIAAVAGAAGVAGAITGAGDLIKAGKTMEDAKKRHEANLKSFEKENTKTCKDMDLLGETELKILKSFEDFSLVFEKIKNRPEFVAYSKDDIQIPRYDGEKLKEVSVGAGVLLGGLGGAALGTAGGFAAAGATTSAVMALGTASTGTPIALLGGAAATKATLAALGGGAIAAGGGGIALGTTILGATTLGVGILVGGALFHFVGKNLSSKADEAWNQMKEAEHQIAKINTYLSQLSGVSRRYLNALNNVSDVYYREFDSMKTRVNIFGLVDYREYNEEQRRNVENTVLLVQLLYRMCQVRLVLKSDDENGLNRINSSDITDVIDDSRRFLQNEMHVQPKREVAEVSKTDRVSSETIAPDRCILQVSNVYAFNGKNRWHMDARVCQRILHRSARFTVFGEDEARVITVVQIGSEKSEGTVRAPGKVAALLVECNQPIWDLPSKKLVELR